MGDSNAAPALQRGDNIARSLWQHRLTNARPCSGTRFKAPQKNRPDLRKAPPLRQSDFVPPSPEPNRATRNNNAKGAPGWLRTPLKRPAWPQGHSF